MNDHGPKYRVRAAFGEWQEHPGAVLRRVRAALGLTQAALGDALAVGQQAVCRWERGQTLPLPVCVQALRRLLADRGLDPGMLPSLEYVPTSAPRCTDDVHYRQRDPGDYPPPDAHLRVRALRLTLGFKTHAAFAAAIGCSLRDAWRWEERAGVNTVAIWQRLVAFAAERGVALVLSTPEPFEVDG